MRSFVANFILLSLLLPLQVGAHGGGQTVQKESGEYLVTLDAVSQEIRSGAAERINFEIERSSGTSTVAFSHVWVRIIDPDGDLLFAGNIQSAPQGFVTGISYLFPSSGEYSITVRFLEGEHMIAEADLPVLVVGGEKSDALIDLAPLAYILALGIFLGGLSTFVFLRFKTGR